MTAEEHVRAGNLAEALAELQARVRSQPGSAPLRVFLFQLLAVMGQWSRALAQLDTAGELDAGSLAMRATYRGALQCEALREEIFAGRRTPTIFGRPEPWMALLLEALRLDGEEKHAEAQQFRAQAFEAAPVTAGKIDETPFAWIADGDSRFGPMLEAIVNGRYTWIPFARLKKLQFEKPSDLRDLVWTPVQLHLANGGETVALIPTRYPGSERGGDARLTLSRSTEWRQPVPDTQIGLGQRILVTDAGDHPILDARIIELEGTPGEDAVSSTDDPSAEQTGEQA